MLELRLIALRIFGIKFVSRRELFAEIGKDLLHGRDNGTHSLRAPTTYEGDK